MNTALRSVIRVQGVEIEFRTPSLRRCLANGTLIPESIRRAQAEAAGVIAEDRIADIRAKAADYYAFLCTIICDAAVRPRIVLSAAEIEGDPDALLVSDFGDAAMDAIADELRGMMQLNEGDLEVIAPFRHTGDDRTPEREVGDEPGGAR